MIRRVVFVCTALALIGCAHRPSTLVDPAADPDVVERDLTVPDLTESDAGNDE
jgi:hypothetical protein